MGGGVRYGDESAVRLGCFNVWLRLDVLVVGSVFMA
jgi:hypothetical protein